MNFDGSSWTATHRSRHAWATDAQLLEGKVTPSRCALARFVIEGGRPRDVVGTLDFLVDYVAKARDWRVARVHTARPLDEREPRPSSTSLSTLTGKNVELQVAEEPDCSGSPGRSRRPSPRRDHPRTPGGAARRRLLGRLYESAFESKRLRKGNVMTELTISATEITEALRKHVTDSTRPSGPSRSGASSRSATASRASRACPRRR